MTKLGHIFGESIITTNRQPARNAGDLKEGDFKSRIFFFQALLFIAYSLIIVQLIFLTVVRGDYYNTLSKQNRIRENIYPAPRGVITDRKGEVLVRNKPGFVASVPCGDRQCYKKISHDEALRLESQNKVSPLSLGVTREYIDSLAFSHLLGTVGQVQTGEIGQNHCGKKLTFSDELGRSGVEEAFDCKLQGTVGRELIETDALGNKIKTLSKIEPAPGQTLTLSIDKRLQLKAKEALEGKKGVVIVHIPQTGELLVLSSSPSFDLNPFIEGLSEEEYNKLVNDPDKPLFNRAIAGTYPPGSTFKPILAAGALTEKVIDENTQIEDTGIIRIGSFSFPNWYFIQYGKTEGLVNVVTALKRSNDIFFYKVGESLGVDKIASWARKFKLGQKLGIEISGEEEGTIPDKVWKEKEKAEQWFLGDTYHISIGQGDILVTPLQLAFAFGAFANNGIICRPTIVKTNTCDKLTDKIISAKTLETIKEGLTQACETGGTAYPFFNFKVDGREIKVACKTGTAEYGDPKDKTHAWFTSFAPLDNPQIVVTVLVEGGGEGSAVAAPIARDIFTEWFKT